MKDFYLHLIELTEVCLGRLAKTIFYNDLLFFKQLADKVYEQEKKGPVDASIDAFGGMALVEHLCSMVKQNSEYFEEGQTRGYNLEEKRDAILVAYTVLTGYVMKHQGDFKKGGTFLPKERISLEHVKRHLNAEEIVDDTEILLEKYKPSFVHFQNLSKKYYSKLHSFAKQVPSISLRDVYNLGVSGLREKWRQSSLISNRINFQYIGLKDLKDSFFRKEFIETVMEEKEKDDEAEVVILYRFLRLVNDFVCEIQSSKKVDEIPEMQVALDYYLSKG